MINLIDITIFTVFLLTFIIGISTAGNFASSKCKTSNSSYEDYRYCLGV